MGACGAWRAGDETSAAYYLEALAAVVGQDNPQRAVRLLAVARSQLEASGSGWLHAYVPRAPHDDAVLAALRARIGDAGRSASMPITTRSSPGPDLHQARSAASATECAPAGSVLRPLPVANTRTCADSLGGTSKTVSPSWTRRCARCRPMPLQPSTA